MSTATLVQSSERGTIQPGQHVQLKDGRVLKVQRVSKRGVCTLVNTCGGFACFSHAHVLKPYSPDPFDQDTDHSPEQIKEAERLPVCIPVISNTPGTHWLSYPRGWRNPLKYVVVPIYTDGRPLDIFAEFCATVDDFGTLVKVGR